MCVYIYIYIYIIMYIIYIMCIYIYMYVLLLLLSLCVYTISHQECDIWVYLKMRSNPKTCNSSGGNDPKNMRFQVSHQGGGN